MYHFKTVVNGLIPGFGIIKNIWYFRSDENHYPDRLRVLDKFYAPIQDDLDSEFVINNITNHLWEGPADGVWYDFDATPPKPTPIPPWGPGVDSGTGDSFNGHNITDEMLPLQMAPVIYMKTPKKHVIARKFFGAYTEGYGAGGVMITAVKDRLQIVADNIMLPFAEGYAPWQCEVWGPKYGFQPLLSATISQYLGTQRRRKPGVGV